MRIVRPVGEAALLIEWTEVPELLASRKARVVAAHLERSAPAGLRDWTLGARSLLLTFDPLRFDERAVARSAAIWENDFAALPAGRRHDVPVCYGGAGGIDLEELAGERGISAAAFAERHASVEYRVSFLGFSPGFAYLGGLPKDLASPRLASPRMQVPWCSVAIGGSSTGIYPESGPGGWRLIGRTPAVLFDPRREDGPAALAPGDRVRFFAIPEWQFAAMSAAAGRKP